MPLDLAALMVEARAISAEDMQRAVQRQRDAGGGLDTALLELGLVPEAELIGFLARVSGLPPARVTPGDCDARASRVFPAGIAQRHRLAPFRLDGRELSLVSAHPVDPAGLADLGVMLSMQLVPYVAPEWRVLELIQALYGVPMPARVAHVAARMRGANAAPTRTAAAPTSAPRSAEPRLAERTWRLARADPEEPLAMAVAHASETLDATEVLGDVLEPDPIPEEPPRWSLGEAAAALDTAADRDAVVAVALRHTRDFLEAAALFAVSRDGVTGIDAIGWPGARQRCRSLHLRDGDAGLFRIAIDTRGPYLGPVQRDAANEQLLRALGRPWPAVVLAYPIVVRDRVVSILYGDNGDAPVSPRRIGDLLLFAGALGSGLERVLRDTKASQRAPPSAAPEDSGGWCLHEPAQARDPAPGTAGAPALAAAGEPFRVVSAASAVDGAPPPPAEDTP